MLGTQGPKIQGTHRLQADNRRAEGVDIRQDVLTLNDTFYTTLMPEGVSGSGVTPRVGM